MEKKSKFTSMNLDVDFMFRVRDERKFASLDDLKQQLKRDERFIRHYFD